jgi:hypothetical protein
MRSIAYSEDLSDGERYGSVRVVNPFREIQRKTFDSSAKCTDCQAPRCRTASPGWTPLKLTSVSVARERRGPQNAFDITFPQGVIWGLIGCMMTFGMSLVTERTHGTLVRLRSAPLSRGGGP